MEMHEARAALRATLREIEMSVVERKGLPQHLVLRYQRDAEALRACQERDARAVGTQPVAASGWRPGRLT